MKVASIMFTSANVRIAAWALFALCVFWNYQAWIKDYAPPPVAATATATSGSAAAPAALDSAAPSVAAPAAAAPGAAPGAAPAASTADNATDATSAVPVPA